MRFSINTVTNIHTIPLYVPPNISNSAVDYEKKNFNYAKIKLPNGLAHTATH
jgi:hypothetical protein